MKPKILLDKSDKPNNETLSKLLGTSYKYWEKLKEHLGQEYGGFAEEWKYYGQKLGWSLKILRKKRNLFFFTACDGFFRISFVFGEKAVATVEQSKLPKKLIDDLVNAKKYAEGRGVQIEVKTRSDVENVKTLVRIKIEN